MKFFIVAGGTGGHIFPGVALFEELRDRGHSVFFISGKKDSRFPIMKTIGYHLIPVPAAPLYRRKIYKNFYSIVMLFKSIKRSLTLMRGLKPDAVIGMGGYVTGPVLLAAKLRGVPTIVCEQNAYPGLANRFFARFAKSVLINFEDARDHFPKRMHTKILTAGNPVRPDFQQVSRDKARKFFSIKANQTVLGILGGSQGAASINKAALASLKQLKDVAILWSCGEASYATLAAQTKKYKNITLFSFCEQMTYFLAACDLVVSRAGATSLSELSSMGLPSVLVPYPYATGDHQTKNAAIYKKTGAAEVLIDDEELEQKFLQTVPALLESSRELQRMRKQSAALYNHKTLSRMADHAEYVVTYMEKGAANDAE